MRGLALMGLAVAVAVGCGNSSTDLNGKTPDSGVDSSAGTGGSSGSGGGPATGGSSGSGGGPATGGSSGNGGGATGGAGGATGGAGGAMGGSSGSGGATGGTGGATGGAGGSSGSGGVAGSGGATGGTGGATGGTGGATGGTGGAGGATGGAGGATGGAGGATGGAGGSGGLCAVPCQFDCCNGTCVNLKNDINNCGTCGHKCTGSFPYCDQGTCGTPPCQGGTSCKNGLCCGSQCCSQGQICCTYQQNFTVTTCVKPTAGGTCPQGCAACVCASPDTPIATPSGDRPIASLRAGDLVYSVDHGRVVTVPLLAVHSVPAHHHFVVRVTLATGSVLEISPAHPTTDGRTFGDLKKGAKLDGVEITDVRIEPYKHKATYDILPDSDTASYFAGGVLIGSTMAPLAKRVDQPTAPLSR